MSEDIIRLLASVIEIFIMGYLFFSLLNRRYDKRKSFILYGIYAVLAVAKHLLFYDQMAVRTTLHWGMTLAVMLILFTDSFWRKIGVLALYAVTISIVETVCMMTTALLFNENVFSEHKGISPLYLIAMALNPLCVYAVTLIAKRKKANFEEKAHRFLTLYCIMQIFTVFVMYIVLWDYKISATPLMIFYLIMLAASVLFGIYLLRMVRAATAEQARAERLALQAKLADEHFRRLQIQYEQYRKLRHDYYNHIGVIRTINDPEKRAAYIDELTQKIEDRNGIAFCSNVALDALLFNEKAQADAAGVKISYKIGDLSDVKIPDFDVCTVLSNLLDNAIRAAAECEGERFVELTMTVSAGQLAIRVANSAKEPEKDLSTTKQDRALHGLGLSIVTETAQKYHGAAAYTYENGVFSSVFSAPAR